MAIREHPLIGTILICDFSSGFRVPEMAKKRPVVVVSHKIGGRPGLCTVVALSASAPNNIMPYHGQIDIDPAMPDPWSSRGVWIKGDMINAVGFHRLNLIRTGKDYRGVRQYRYEPLSHENLQKVRECILKGIGLSSLTKHLT